MTDREYQKLKRELDFRNLVRTLLADGIFPSPSAINKARGKAGKQNILGSDHTRWRREELHAAGFRQWDASSRVLKNPKPMGNPRFFHPDWDIIGGRLRKKDHTW